MCTAPRDRAEAQDTLENAITAIGGLADVLFEMGKHRDNEFAPPLRFGRVTTRPTYP